VEHDPKPALVGWCEDLVESPMSAMSATIGPLMPMTVRSD